MVDALLPPKVAVAEAEATPPVAVPAGGAVEVRKYELMHEAWQSAYS